MRQAALAGMLVAALALASCNDKKTSEVPPPHELTASAVGNYCGMNVLEHSGPKGQIILASRLEPIWFSSARDAFSFMMLPEEPKDIRAVYVSDMTKAPSWEHPGEMNWVDAKKAFYVVSSRVKGGMGAEETVPFSDRSTADKFVTENGGRVVTFAEMPRDYVLGEGAETMNPAPEPGPASRKHDDSSTQAGRAGHAH